MVLSATTDRMLQHPIYQQLLEGGYGPLFLSVVTERILLHHIYQLLLEAGYDPLVLSAATERMLWHLIYQLPLEGGYDHLAWKLPSLAPPYHSYLIIWSLTALHQSIYQLNVQRRLFRGLNHCLYTLKHISSFNIHLYLLWLFTDK